MKGSQIGSFGIAAELGSGGMGVVYQATCLGDSECVPRGQVVALKVLHPQFVQSRIMLERFRREVELGSAIVHPNVVRMYGSGEADGVCFIVMEHVKGQTLLQLLDELESLPEELCRHVGRGVAAGLSAIHAVGAVHRDLKPANVLITPDHEIRVMDLGVARFVEQRTRLSLTGSFVGSLQYAAPEQFYEGGKNIDERADVHALGVLLFELATGRNPFLDRDVSSTMQRVLTEKPPDLRDLNPGISAFFATLVSALMEKVRGDRVPTAVRALELLTQGEESGWWCDRDRESAERSTPLPQLLDSAPRPEALHGRTVLLQTLLALEAFARAGEGQVVVLEGEEGIGKSRLAEELMERLRAEDEPIHVLYGGFLPGAPAAFVSAVGPALRHVFGRPGSARYLPETPQFARVFDALLRGDPTPFGETPLSPDGLLTCLVGAVQSLAAERRTVLVVEDLHNADAEALELLGSIALAVPGHRLLVLATSRGSTDSPGLGALAEHDHVTVLAVERIGPHSLTQMLEDALGSRELAAAIGVAMAMRSEGNPYIVLEILRELRERRVIAQQPDGTWQSVGDLSDVTIPDSVRGVVKVRLAALDHDDRELLEVAACAGFRFDPNLIAEALGEAAIPTLRQFARIEKRHQLMRSVGRECVFDHDQVRECLLAGLPPTLVEEYHSALGAALERRAQGGADAPSAPDGATCVGLVSHFLASASATRAVPYLSAALDELDRTYSVGRGIALLERALAIPGMLTGVQRIEELLRLARWLERTGRDDDALAAAREADGLAEEGSNPVLHSRAALVHGNALRAAARHAESRRVLQRAADAARAAEDLSAEAAALGGLGIALTALGEHAAALELFARRREIGSALGDATVESDARGARGDVLLRIGRARAALEEFEGQLREITSDEGRAFAEVNVGRALTELGRLDEAIEHLLGGVFAARKAGTRRAELAAVARLGEAHLLRGSHDDARSCFLRQAALAREVGSERDAADAVANAADLLMAQGRGADALRAFEGHLDACERAKYGSGGARAHLALAQLFASFGVPERAHHHFAHAVAHACERPQLGLEGLALAAYATFQLDLSGAGGGDRDERAVQLLDQSIALLRAAEHGHGLAWSLRQRARALARHGETERARALLAEAAACADRSGLPGIALLVACDEARLPGDPAPAGPAGPHGTAAAHVSLSERVRAVAGRLAHRVRMEASFAAWEVAGDADLLADAKRLLDEFLDRAPPDLRDVARSRVPLHRAIARA